MTLATIAQVGGSLLGGLGKKKAPKPPMAQADPSFGVLQNNQNPLPANQNMVQSPGYQQPKTPPINSALPNHYNTYGSPGKGVIMNNLTPPPAPPFVGPYQTQRNNPSMNINGNNPTGQIDVSESNELDTSIPALIGSGAGVLYDIFNHDKPEYERKVDPYTKQMVSQSANATSMANANANNIAGSIMAGASGAADKAMTATLGNSMATGGGVDNMALGATKSAIENNQMNTAYSGGMAQGGSISAQAMGNHAQTLGRASDQTMYREYMPIDSLGLKALQGLSAIPKVIADGETFANQQDWRRNYSHQAKSQDSTYQTAQTQQKKKNGVFNPMDLNSIFSQLTGRI